MTITVNTPDGGTASFPDGTDPGVITSAMKAKFGGPDDDKPLFSLTGTDKIGEFVGKMSDAATAGFGAKALDALGLGQGPSGQTVAKQVQAAGQDIGPGWSAAADVAGAAVPGVGLGGRLAKGAEALGAGSRLAAGLGGAGEAAGLTAAGDVGHDETPGMDVLYSGALGGALGHVIGKPSAGTPPVGQSIADLQTAKDAAIQAAENTKIGNYPAYKVFDTARNSLTPGEQSGLSGAMKSQLNDTQDLIANNPTLTGRDVWSMRKNLASNSVVNTAEDAVASKKVGDALYSLAPQEIRDASMAHGQLSDATWLNDALSGKMSMSDAIAQAAKGVAPGSKNVYSTPGRDAMTELANAGPSQFSQNAQTIGAKGINKLATGATLGVLGHGVGGWLGDPTLGTLLGAEGGLTAGSGGLGRGVVNQVMNRTPFSSNASQKRALRAALAAISSGQPATAAMYEGKPLLAQAAKAGLLGGAAAGNF